jgi:hypothetical protein
MRSVNADNRDNCAVLGVWNDGPKLNWNWNDNENPIYGAASAGSFFVRQAPSVAPVRLIVANLLACVRFFAQILA